MTSVCHLPAWCAFDFGWVGILGREGFPLENAAARVCLEAGGRVRTNAFLRDMDLDPINPLDARRLEVVVDGLPMFGGSSSQSTRRCPDGAAKPRAATMSGAYLEVARRRKEARYPEFVGNQGRARLVVLAGEVGGRFSSETAQFLQDLTNANVREVPHLLKGRAHSAWIRRCSFMLACAAARAFAISLLEGDSSVGAEGPTPSVHAVLGGDHRAV